MAAAQTKPLYVIWHPTSGWVGSHWFISVGVPLQSGTVYFENWNSLGVDSLAGNEKYQILMHKGTSGNGANSVNSRAYGYAKLNRQHTVAGVKAYLEQTYSLTRSLDYGVVVKSSTTYYSAGSSMTGSSGTNTTSKNCQYLASDVCGGWNNVPGWLLAPSPAYDDNAERCLQSMCYQAGKATSAVAQLANPVQAIVSWATSECHTCNTLYCSGNVTKCPYCNTKYCNYHHKVNHGWTGGGHQCPNH